jgi:hypothetical protein
MSIAVPAARLLEGFQMDGFQMGGFQGESARRLGPGESLVWSARRADAASFAGRGLHTSSAASTTRTITMIQKLTPDGEQCRKCNDIEARLERDGLLDQIDTHIYMDTEDPSDPGTKLAVKHEVKVAPFFVVHSLGAAGEEEDVYTAYLKMKKQVFGKAASQVEADNDVAMSIF